MEGRTWYSPHRGRLWIASASHVPTQAEIDQVEQFYQRLYEDVSFPVDYPIGELLGAVDVIDCLTQEDFRSSEYQSEESQSPYLFITTNPQYLPSSFSVKGKHKIWQLPQELHQKARRTLRKSMHAITESC